MGIINILDTQTSNMIAAGEVVGRVAIRLQQIETTRNYKWVIRYNRRINALKNRLWKV